jgi:hypothetical protein
MKRFTKQSLIHDLDEISQCGWFERDGGKSDAAVGRTLETLLGVEENNLPLPNAGEWELKAKRLGSSALTTLIHCEPSPRTMKFVPTKLLPVYGWPHQKAGVKYPRSEKSFRQTLTYRTYSSRGFAFDIEKSATDSDRFVVKFDPSKVSAENSDWLDNVRSKTGSVNLDPLPFWGFRDLQARLANKLTNAFFVEADKKSINGIEFFHYRRVTMLAGFDFSNFVDLVRSGEVRVDFDARTGHNHGTKFRIPAKSLTSLYGSTNVVVEHSKL